uniref:Uncharacterized protein n=1 Tax=Aegilops tauschii TaxID=37682 RepID=N1QWC6_AEGTA
MSFIASDVAISVFAPMVEKLRWNCWYATYDRASIVFGIWRLEQSSHALHSEGDTFAQEIEKHMIAEFSILELHLIANGHVFGALMFHLLGVIRICRSMQRLKVILNRSQGQCTATKIAPRHDSHPYVRGFMV